MNEDNGFEYLSSDTKENLNFTNSETKPPIDDYREFVEGLPEWDLEPPYEIVRRNQLWLILNVFLS